MVTSGIGLARPEWRDNETPLLVFESIRKSAAPESRAPKGRAWYRASDGDDRHGDPDVPHDRLRRPRHERVADRRQPDGERPGARAGRVGGGARALGVDDGGEASRPERGALARRERET